MKTIYTTREIKVGVTVWQVTFAKGQSNYVSVKKVTNNPFRTLGKEFKDIYEAISNYKSAQMKLALIQLID